MEWVKCKRCGKVYRIHPCIPAVFDDSCPRCGSTDYEALKKVKLNE